MAKTNIDSRGFFESLDEFFGKAVARVGSTLHHARVAGRPVSLEIAGESLQELVLPSLAHLLTRERVEGDAFRLCVWDTTTSGVGAPPPPFGTGAHLNRGDLVSPPGEPLRLSFPIDSGILECFLPGARRAYVWVRSLDGFGAAQRAVPFRSPWGWWAAESGAQMIHAAAVGVEGRGALLTAPGGSGKSTTSVECLLSGFRFAGDDTVLVERHGETWIASGIFGSARIGREQLTGYRSIPHLLDGRQDKATLLLGESHAASLVDRLPVDVLLVPRVSQRGRTALHPLRSSEALHALAPSSVLFVSGADPSALATLAELSRRVPAYHLELGPQASENVAAVREALFCRQGHP